MLLQELLKGTGTVHPINIHTGPLLTLTHLSTESSLNLSYSLSTRAHRELPHSC